MADGPITVHISSPDREKLTFTCAEVIVPGEDGVFTVLPEHTPFLTTLIPGVVIVFTAEGEELHYAVTDGFAEVKDDTVMLLVQAFEPGDEIDVERAEAAHKRAEEALHRASDTKDVKRAELALQRSIARIGAKKQHYF